MFVDFHSSPIYPEMIFYLCFEKGEVLFRVPYPIQHFAFWHSIVYPFLGVRYHIKFTRASFLSFCWQPLSMYVWFGRLPILEFLLETSPSVNFSSGWVVGLCGDNVSAVVEVAPHGRPPRWRDFLILRGGVKEIDSSLSLAFLLTLALYFYSSCMISERR